MTAVQVQVVTFNSMRHIDRCLGSVLAQTHPHLRLLVLDNGSADGTAAHVRQAFPAVELVELGANLGFARAHNLGIRQAGDAAFVLVLNDDAWLAPDCVARLVAAAAAAPRAGSFQPRLRRPDDRTLDTTGIGMTRSRRSYDRGQGEADLDQYPAGPVFAACGAAALYRREMLAAVRCGDEYFDEAFWAYKEDVDLGWRARLLGWDCLYVPGALGWHVRGWDQGARARMPAWLRVHSFKNRYLMLLKNEPGLPPLAHWPALLAFEVAALGYALVREPALLGAYARVWALRGRWRAWRRLVQSRRTVGPKELRTWFR